MYTFTTLDFNGVCTTVIMCRAQNSYGTSEQYFTLYLNNCSTTSKAHPTPMLLADVSIINDGGKGHELEGTLIPAIAVAAVIPTLAVAILLALLLLLRHKRKRE